ncbi:hypothetical protein Bca52824_016392 [Brassica carinata]|uniref:ABC-2 type transporter transmembrane domain-containing protein n=1 Tax=Brassica carinata TaxID=52824 RepID=A0A8X7W517_BRACI|nr:hypothetical protein Bca52824_016392 [Brassica carinata]
MSIHQPSHRVLGLLNRLIFLSRGRTVFSGSPASLPGFLARFGCPVPENENQTEFALDLIRELEGSAGGTRGLVEFNKRWQEMKNLSPPASPNPNLTLKEAISASISRGKLVSGGGGGGGSSVASHGGFANPFWIEIKTLTERSILNSRRQPELFGTRLATVLVTGFILATVFWRLDNSPKGVQERLGFFAFAMSTMFYTCADALPVFLQERYIFMRETAYNAYRRSSYVLSHAVRYKVPEWAGVCARDGLTAGEREAWTMDNARPDTRGREDSRVNRPYGRAGKKHADWLPKLF